MTIYTHNISSLSSEFGSDFIHIFVSCFLYGKFYHDNFLKLFNIYLATIFEVLTMCQVFFQALGIYLIKK